MRVLMFVAKYPFPIVGGLERQAHELSKALSRRGHIVYALSTEFAAAQRRADVLDGVHVYRVRWLESQPLRFLASSFSIASVLVKLRRHIDLVHVHNVSWFGALVTVVAKIMQLPVVTKLPNTGELGIPGMRRRMFGSLRIMLLRLSDSVVAMSPDILEDIISTGFPPGRILKVPNGISLDSRPSNSPRVGRNRVTVVYAGRLMPQKGLLDLLHAWRAVKASSSRPAVLRVLGDGPQLDQLRSLASELSITESVDFVGFCDDVFAELERADIFVLPSYVEGNSNAILEAMGAGLPVVGTRVGGAYIQVGPQGARYLVSPGNSHELARRLTELIDDESSRQRLGTTMKDRVQKLFNIESIAAIYEDAYQLITTNRRQLVGQLNQNLFSACGHTDTDR